MSKLKVAFQGEPGANSDIAAREVYPDCEPLPCATFEDALAAISNGEAELGMIPIENSIAGRVADIHHLLPHANLHIVGEHFLPIHFNLMAPKGATLKTIKSVESHIHAIGQCRRFIRAHGYKAVIAADTAGAARHISETDDVTRAALAPMLAAKIYGLKVLAERVEDEDHNTTRFVILSRKQQQPVDEPAHPIDFGGDRRDRRSIGTIGRRFQVFNSEPECGQRRSELVGRICDESLLRA